MQRNIILAVKTSKAVPNKVEQDRRLATLMSITTPKRHRQTDETKKARPKHLIVSYYTVSLHRSLFARY